MNPESPKFAVYSLSATRAAITAVVLPIICCSSTQAHACRRRPRPSSWYGDAIASAWALRISARETSPASTPWFAQPPTPSAMPTALGMTNSASSPPVSALSGCGIFAHPLLR